MQRSPDLPIGAGITTSERGHHAYVDDTDSAVRNLYGAILDGWNRMDAAAFADPFVEDGEVIGFDGTPVRGRSEIVEAMDSIFRDHKTGSYIGVVRDVRHVGERAALLRAVSGVVPAGAEDINTDLNAVQSLVAERRDGAWGVWCCTTTHPRLFTVARRMPTR